MEEQKTEFIVRKKDKTENFSIIYNACLKDNSISWQAKGLFGYLMTLPNDWEIYKTELPKHSSNGRDATIKAFNELIEKGYITVEETKGEKGQFGRKIYKVFEVSQGETKIIRKKRNTKQPAADLPLLDNRSCNTVTENPLTVNQELLNTDKQITKELNTNTNSSTSLKSEPPHFSNSNNEVKKSTHSKKPSKTELNEQFISSLSEEDFKLSEKCAELMIEYLKPITTTHDPSVNKVSWQADIAKRARAKKVSLKTVLMCIQYVHDDVTGFEQPICASPEKIFRKLDYLYGKALSKAKFKRQSNKNVDGVNMQCKAAEEYDSALF